MDGPDGGERTRDRSDPRDGSSRSEIGSMSGRGPNGEKADSRANAKHDDTVTIADDGLVRWLLETDERTGTAVRDLATIIVIIAISGSLLFGISGTWPPLVAVESGSMEPHIEQGDLVLITDDGRFTGDGAVSGTGIVTLERGQETEYTTFDAPGDVITFRPNGDPTKTATIHRAHFWVEKGERWTETKADPAFVNGAACAEIASCPAPHDGFITKGDANPAYDQLPRSGAETTVVSPDWVTGKAMFRIPWVGQVRLAIGSIRTIVGTGPLIVGTGGSVLALIWYGTAAGSRDS